MIRITLLVGASVCMILCANCAPTPYEAGRKLAEQHLMAGPNPSPELKAKMQAEANEKTAKYDLAEKQEFMKGYLETMTSSMLEDMEGMMNQTMEDVRVTSGNGE